MAECPVQLPTEVTTNTAKRLNRTRLLTYVLALEESKRAKKQRDETLHTAEQQIAQEAQRRKLTSDKHQAEIDRLKADAERKKHDLTAEAAQQKGALRAEAAQRKAGLNAIAANQMEAARATAEKSKGGLGKIIQSAIICGTSIGCCLCLLPTPGMIIAHFHGAPAEGIWRNLGSFFLFCFLPPFLIAVVVSLPMALVVWLATIHRDQKITAIEQELSWETRELERKLATKISRLETLFATKIAGLGASLATEVDRLEPVLSVAKATEKKSRAALTWLQGQQGQFNG
jgi:hypothetical protein